MRHQCSNCLGEFSDDAPSSSPLERVFCVFCGRQLPSPRAVGSALPFSADSARQEAFALGVIGGGSSGFPDTLRQFRAHGAPGGSDSLTPVHHGSEDTNQDVVAPPWRLRKFWTSLAVGFVVGVGAAVVLGERSATQAPLVASGAAPAARPAVPTPVALSSCAVSPPPVAIVAPAAENKPAVTPRLEKRFWLERARSAQHNYRLADAERLYRRALAHAPRDSEVLAGLGEIELLRGQHASAGARFREALAMNSDYVPARVALADLQWQSGQIEAARNEYRLLAEQYSPDVLPSYVSQRLEGDACAPRCGEAASAMPASTLEAAIE